MRQDPSNNPGGSVVSASRSGWAQRDIADALLIFGLAAIAYGLGEAFQVFAFIGRFVQDHAVWTDRLPGLLFVASVAMIVFAYRHRRAVNAENEAWRRAEVEVEMQMTRLHGAIDNMAHGLCVFDAEARLVFCNDRYLQMYGLDENAVQPGCHFTDLVRHHFRLGLFSGDAEQYIERTLLELRAGRGGDKVIEFEDGRIISVANRPLPSGGRVSIHEDITEQQRAQRELDQMREFLDSIIERVPAAIVVKSLPEFRYVFLNRQATIAQMTT